MTANSDRHKQITKNVALYVANDLKPFSTVENKSFIRFLNVLDPRYDMPGRTHFTNKVFPELYRECRSEVESGLLTADAIAITTDGWTSRATESYITVTSHYITKAWKLMNNVLQTRPIYESHTGDNVGEVLSSAVKEWKLERNLSITCVTDNAANMIVAVKNAGLNHVKCFAHTVNLASQKALKVDNVSRLLAKIRRIVGFFHRSSTATALLKEKQLMLQLPKHSLIQDVSTRWNSSFDMIERYIEQQPAVLSVLMSKEVRKNEKDLGLSETDLCNAEDLVTVLRPLKTITTILCDEKRPTISLIFPLKEKIITLMEVQDGDSVLIRNVKQAVAGDISKRYVNDQDFLQATSAVDPRFRSLPQIDEDQRLSVYTSIIAQTASLLDADQVRVKEEPGGAGDAPLPVLPQLDDMNEDTPLAPPVKQEAAPPVEKSASAIEDLFGDVFVTVTHVEPARSNYARVKEEVNRFKTGDCIPLTSNPLEWWGQHEREFPLMAKYAKCLLCIPGTSVPSERVFSTAGDIVTAQRAQLKAENVNMLIFLKKNMKHI